jgi:hypothetical protein
MVDDFKSFTAWALGVLIAISGQVLTTTLSDRAWVVWLTLFIVIFMVAFYVPCGHISSEIVQFVSGAIEARAARKEINESTKREEARLILTPEEIRKNGV